MSEDVEYEGPCPCCGGTVAWDGECGDCGCVVVPNEDEDDDGRS